MMFIFIIQWKFRCKNTIYTEEIAFDDVPEETTFDEAKQWAINEFHAIRARRGSKERDYLITDVLTA